MKASALLVSSNLKPQPCTVHGTINDPMSMPDSSDWLLGQVLHPKPVSGAAEAGILGSYRGIMENKMETTLVDWGYI